jgi:hypothetical protein
MLYKEHFCPHSGNLECVGVVVLFAGSKDEEASIAGILPAVPVFEAYWDILFLRSLTQIQIVAMVTIILGTTPFLLK